MAKRLQLRRGTTAENNAFTGALSEVTVDTDKDVLVVHDGVTAGGFPVAARANANGTISLIKKDGTAITTIPTTGLFNNTLTSTNTDQALTAAQGKVLKDTKLETTSAFGVAQSWQDVTSSRVTGTTYTNTTSRTIVVNVTANGYQADTRVTANIQGVSFIIGSDSAPYNTVAAGSFVVPSGVGYSVSVVLGSLQTWHEFR